MKTVILCAAFYGLGVFNCAVFAAVYLLHRPRYVAPTMHNRQSPPPARDNLQAAIISAAKTEGNTRFAWQTEAKLGAQHEDGIRYEWINLTGEER